MGWSNQAVTLIILEEAATGFTGLFAYSPAPGPGALVASITASAGADQYGNQYLAGITAYSAAANAEAQLGPIGLQVLTASLAVAGTLGIASGGGGFYLSAPGPFELMSDPIHAVAPGSPPSPLPESWHDLTADVAAGWTAAAAPSNPRVKLLPSANFAYINGQATHASFSGTSTILTLPAGSPYIPAAFQSVPGTTSGGTEVQIQVNTSGTVVVVGAPAATTAVYWGGDYPLD